MPPPALDVRFPYVPPSAPAPDEGPADLIPEWLSPQVATVGAAVLGTLVLVVFLALVVRRIRGGKKDEKKEGDPWTRLLLVLVLGTSPVMIALTFYGSFHAVEQLAFKNGVSPSWIPPVAIDGILLLFLFLDLLFARLNRPSPFVQTVTRGFIVLTLVANAASGWPNPVAVLLHVPAPLALVVLTEVARRALVEDAEDRNGETDKFDRVPWQRWLLDPLGTASLRRWMILFHVTDYRQALAADMARRDALAILRSLSPSQRAQVPGHLSRRLRQGMNLAATVREVRMLAATVTAGYHLAPRGVPSVSPSTVSSTRAGSSTPGVDEGTTPASTSTADRVDVHVESTHPSTPAPAGGVDEAPVRVDHRVDADGADEAPAPVADPVPTPAGPSVPAPRVDEVDQDPAGEANRVDVHMGQGWRTPGVHHAAPGPVWDEAPNEVDANGADEAPAPVVALDTDTDGDEDGPDDDGPRGGGGGAPTPVPVDVVPGQISVDEALAQVAAPSPLDVARVALDAPVWDDLDEAATKKAQVMALLWEFSGDAAAVRDAYAERTGQEVPRDLYRKGPRGYAWAWHHQVTAYLIREYGHADTVRAVLADAGVDHDHEAVTAALDEWSDTHSHQVIQFRRVPLGT